MDCTSDLYSNSLHCRNNLVLCDIRRWTGELPIEGVGEFLHSRIDFHRTVPCLLPLLIMDFIILTTDSALPFAFG